MCFRPSAVVNNESQVQYGECPSCGNPVATKIDVASGTCPHCGNAIPANNLNENNNVNLNHNIRII